MFFNYFIVQLDAMVVASTSLTAATAAASEAAIDVIFPEVITRLAVIVREGDLAALSFKDIMKQLTAEFKVTFGRTRKDALRDEIQRLLNIPVQSAQSETGIYIKYKH